MSHKKPETIKKYQVRIRENDKYVADYLDKCDNIDAKINKFIKMGIELEKYSTNAIKLEDLKNHTMVFVILSKTVNKIL